MQLNEYEFASLKAFTQGYLETLRALKLRPEREIVAYASELFGEQQREFLRDLGKKAPATSPLDTEPENLIEFAAVMAGPNEPANTVRMAHIADACATAMAETKGAWQRATERAREIAGRHDQIGMEIVRKAKGYEALPETLAKANFWRKHFDDTAPAPF